jgi:acetyltransferase-like isoleucine patch superfamily enzyme
MKLRVILSEFNTYICNNVINRIPSHTIRLFYYRKVMRFKIGKGSHIFLHCTFDTALGLQMGENSVINAKCRLDTRGGIFIGNNVSISNETTILSADHDMDNNMDGRVKSVHLDDYIWIGTRAMILPGVSIQRGAVIAAGAVVSKNVEENTVVGGIPAKFIKTRVNPSFNYTANYKRLFH